MNNSLVIYDNYQYVLQSPTAFPQSISYQGYQFWGPYSNVKIVSTPQSTSTIGMGGGVVTFDISANDTVQYTYIFQTNVYILYGSEIIFNNLSSSNISYVFLVFTTYSGIAYTTAPYLVTPGANSLNILIRSSLSGIYTAEDPASLLSFTINIYNPNSNSIMFSFGPLTSTFTSVPSAYVYDNLTGISYSLQSMPPTPTSFSIFSGPFMIAYPKYTDSDGLGLSVAPSDKAYISYNSIINQSINVNKAQIIVPNGTSVTMTYTYGYTTGFFLPRGTVISVILGDNSVEHEYNNSYNYPKKQYQNGLEGALMFTFNNQNSTFFPPKKIPGYYIIYGQINDNEMQFMVPSTFYTVTSITITISTQNISCSIGSISILGVTSTIPLNYAIYDNYNFKQTVGNNVSQYYPTNNPTNYWYPQSERSVDIYNAYQSRNALIPGNIFVNSNNVSMYAVPASDGMITTIIAYHLSNTINLSADSYIGIPVLSSLAGFSAYVIGTIVNNTRGTSYQMLLSIKLTSNVFSTEGYLFLIPIRGTIINASLIGFYVNIYGVSSTSQSYDITLGPLVSNLNKSCTLMYDNCITLQQSVRGLNMPYISGQEVPYQGYQSWSPPSTRTFLSTHNNIAISISCLKSQTTRGRYILQSINKFVVPILSSTFWIYISNIHKHISGIVEIIYTYTKTHNEPLFNSKLIFEPSCSCTKALSIFNIPPGTQFKLIGYGITFYVPILKIITGSDDDYTYHIYPGTYDGSNTVFTTGNESISNVTKIKLEITISPNEFRDIFFISSNNILCEARDLSMAINGSKATFRALENLSEKPYLTNNYPNKDTQIDNSNKERETPASTNTLNTKEISIRL